MYDTVLIPTDGSDPAERAVGYGVALAESYAAAVHAVSVVDERDYNVIDGEELVERGRASGEREARRALEAVTDLAGEATTEILTGVPAEAILDYVSATDVDIVVMGTHGRTGLERFVIGSVAEKVVRLADVPVLTVRPTAVTLAWPPVDRVLFPTDGSDASFSALPRAVDLAERFGAVLEGLYVVDERTKSTLYNAGTALEDMVGGLQAAGERAMGRLRDESDDRDVTVETGVVEGLPSETICSHAEQSGADIVVMSTHGRTGLEHFFLGSVTERVVRNSTTPVLTTPTREADESRDADAHDRVDSGETD